MFAGRYFAQRYFAGHYFAGTDLIKAAWPMTSITTSYVQEFYKGEKPLIGLTPGIQGQGGLLRVGQTISAVTWNPEAPVTVDGASSQIVTTVQANDTTQVEVDLTAIGIQEGVRYTLEAVWTLANPTEIRQGYMVIQIKKKPV